MQEKHGFEHERNLDETLTNDEKVRKLWRERELRLYMRARRADLFKLWVACLSAAATAGTLISLIVGNWKK